jgi:predicted anti-sigma-YlaC factor YlaD
MRCSKIRETLELENNSQSRPAVREHLAVCSECRTYATNLSKLAAGMKLLAEEPVPEPSIGFQLRVLRRLDQESRRDFLERAGQRVVYATLIVVLFLLLAMIVPSSGPVRSSPKLENYQPQEETVAERNYQIPMNMEGVSAAPVLVDLKSSGSGGR